MCGLDVVGVRGSNTLQGYACRFQRVFHHEGRFMAFHRGAFAQYLAAGRPVRFLVKHDASAQLGSTADRLELEEDDVGLAFRMALPNTDLGGAAKLLVHDGDFTGMSVSFKSLNETEVE